ncbi:pleckstrin homology domain-containing family F member 2-like isoform X2 [Penaeus chinensis]|uniref:pleckstrin homology domain-containing family F member 2-like isoform X2 n=1 Tax=Penaeus chinensis TaxID=139456 RepID=UPI001FB64B10|nr:pleckstrin homology domain-containing family F member 2-like isoform X2 [Penaeus chinensis]
MVDRLVNSEANTRRIAMVESCFGTSGQPLNVPGRVLVGEGVLTKMCRKKPKPRQFFLFNDILVYGNIVLNKKKYNKQHIIPLEEVQLSSIEDDGQFRNGWLIKTPTKSFAVYAATATEKGEWMAHINKCVTDLLRKSGKKAAEKHAAVWVPDGETQVCMHCKKTQFTLINRRHHCRKCGKVVCGPCSSKKVLLIHQSNKPLRVCLTCYDELSSAQTEAGNETPINSMAGRMIDITLEGDDIGKDSDSNEDISIAHLHDPNEELGPVPPPRRTSRARTGEDKDKQEGNIGADLVDIPCDLFGDPNDKQDDDALPPTLWWDDIDLKEPLSDGEGEEGMKERADSSGDDDSDDDTDDPSLQSPQSPTETMTFYEGGEASNGEASTMLDASASSAVETPAASDASTVDATPNPTE